MSQSDVGKIFLASIFIVFGSWIALFNFYRHFEMWRARRCGQNQNISSVPFVGSLFYFLGIYTAPLNFSWYFYLFIFTEIATINFINNNSEEKENLHD